MIFFFKNTQIFFSLVPNIILSNLFTILPAKNVLFVAKMYEVVILTENFSFTYLEKYIHSKITLPLQKFSHWNLGVAEYVYV